MIKFKVKMSKTKFNGNNDNVGNDDDDVCKEDEIENDNFIYNDLLARALVQLFSKKERSLIHLWLEKLRTANIDSKEKLSNRNNYMWFLLIVLQNGNLIEPFDEPPPIDDLLPISDIMPAQMIEEMVSSNDMNFLQLDLTSSDINVMDLKEVQNTGIPPDKFLQHQPRPVNGISCYFSIFSKP